MTDIAAKNYGDAVISDKLITDRARGKNKAVWLLTTAFIQGVTTVGAAALTHKLLGSAIPLPMPLIGGVAGFTVGLLANTEVLKRSIVNNALSQAFVTVDSLKVFQGADNQFVTYGPGGPHISKWWEQRSSENSINLEIASVNFMFTVQCADGILTGKGSFRLRADIRHAVKYLRGFNAIADDVGELIIAHAVTELAGKKVGAATKLIEDLNTGLQGKFAGEPSSTPTSLEKEYGVHFIDVTVNELLPSEAMQKTITALAEARMIKAGTAELLGMTQAAAKKALGDKSLSREDYNNARDRFLSVSGNLEGMNISRQEFDINLKGLEPESIKDILFLARRAGLFNSKNKGGRKK